MRCNGGSNACKKQHLTSVDIAYPHDQTPRQQHLLDGRATRLEPRFEGRIGKVLGQRLYSQPAQQLLRHDILLAGRIDHGAETPGIMQTQCSF